MNQSDLDLLRAYASNQPVLGKNGKPLPAGALKARVAAANQRMNDVAAADARTGARQQQSLDLQQKRLDLSEQRTQAQAEREQQRRSLRNLKTGIRGVDALGENVGNRFDELNGLADRFATPGGVMPLILALLVMTSAIVPVNNGKTRLELLWLTITGKTRLPDPNDTNGSSGSGGSSGSDNGIGSDPNQPPFTTSTRVTPSARPTATGALDIASLPALPGSTRAAISLTSLPSA